MSRFDQIHGLQISKRVHHLQQTSALRDARTRRIKCDERHPRCLRCCKSGFKCEYDAVQAITPGSAFVIYSAGALRLSPRDLPDADPRDLRALNYFQSLTILEIGGPWSTELFTKFLLPMSRHECSIRQAVVALGTLHEGYVEAGGSTKTDLACSTQRHALMQYGAAVRSVMALRINQHQRNAIDVALVASILFASIENLRGHTKTSLIHVFSGLRILQGAEEEYPNAVCESIPRHLLRIVLQRLVGQVFETGYRDIIPVVTVSSDLGKTETGLLLNAISQTEALHYRLHHFFHHQTLSLAKISNIDIGGVYATIAEAFGSFKFLLEQIKVKHKAFLLSSRGCSKEDCEDRNLLLFNVMVTNLEIIFNVHKTMNEMSPDTLIRKFREHLDWSGTHIRTFSRFTGADDCSERATNTTSVSNDGSKDSRVAQSGRINKRVRGILPKPATSLAPSFSANPGVVPSLYMTAARCQDPVIRREALQLLKACDRREGLWDSNIAAGIISRIIEIEDSPLLET
ncbi:uncharacterized protein A1O9_07021 [Exophiala aquamarina CBS 119918]|uniref:Zn(2)-C6 fungal-type domain-containing protein n=1 Tax=Exophiala aquamarina CBS 119918 TaxID=1182545 RepID=A0A072PAF9_9EURO|nr:uncharacterized protein A1O9_07021 [Exophiala aquamarina CBS 119918]KEF56831.1 hypothetical protein A1O9_07021 [Exophiala aquamarina CBS 119918]